jgi:hypothetical protein
VSYHHLMPVEANEQRLPSAEDEARFSARVEAAWAQCSVEANRARRALAARAPGPDTDLSAVGGALPVFLGTLADQCRELPGGELTSLDRVLERKLYDIDRADIQAVTDGSEDGFLYARGFIVAMGRDFYDAVTGDPQMAVMDAECEEMCYFFAHLYRERFGEFPETGSGISRRWSPGQRPGLRRRCGRTRTPRPAGPRAAQRHRAAGTRFAPSAMARPGGGDDGGDGPGSHGRLPHRRRLRGWESGRP